MPVQSTNTSTDITFTTSPETLTIAPGVIVGVSAATAVISTMNSSILINYGSIVAADLDCYGVQFNADSSVMVNQLNAVISGYDGMFFGGGSGSSVNFGSIF